MKNDKVLGERDKAFSIFKKNDFGKVFGGIQAFLGAESAYIDVLWVEGNLQKQRYSTKILATAEGEATKNAAGVLYFFRAMLSAFESFLVGYNS